MMLHRFDPSLKTGKDGERVLDLYFSTWYIVYLVELDVEKQHGIDRFFMSKKTGDVFSVEYKTDLHTTGNVFIEVVSNDQTNAPGWALKCHAHVLCYHIVAANRIYVAYPHVIREQLPRWEKTYRKQPVINEGYTTYGLLVPVAEFRRFTLKVLELQPKAA